MARRSVIGKHVLGAETENTDIIFVVEDDDFIGAEMNSSN